MKKILFAAATLDVGGIETALVTLLNYLAQENKYDITLVLEKKQGIFLNDLNSNINVIEYSPSKNRIVPIRKIENFIKQRLFSMKYKNKFDFSAAYATYSKPAVFVAQTASENSCLFGHMDYLAQFKGNEEELKKYFEERKARNFKNIVFVSKAGKNSFLKAFPELKDRTHAINNLIDYKKIINSSNEMIPEVDDDIITFVNVGRHDEEQKKLSRIIEASKKLKDDGLEFRVLFVGDGKDRAEYEKQVKDLGLEDEIIFLGKRRNPYPFYKLADAVVLSSDYEGYPVVFIESMVLGKPIITTDVSDYEDVKGKYGIVCEKNSDSLYKAMKDFINNEFIKTDEFNPEKFNQNIIDKLEKIIKEED